MRVFLILCFVVSLSAGCSTVKTASSEKVQAEPNRAASTVSPTPEAERPLKPVQPNVKLNARRQKYLDESLPPKAREILEKAERFEILAEVETPQFKDGSMNFEPNRIAVITGEDDKKAILEAFYSDAATDEPPASCYLPHHKIRAVYAGQTVEVEICFECSRFTVASQFGKFAGTLKRDDPKSEEIFNRIVETKGVELTK